MMDIKHRQQDVKELVCKACQDFIRLILPENWQQPLFKELETLIRGDHADNYIGAYGKMCDKGIENYHVEDMDTAFISNLVRFSRIIKTSDSTKKAIAEVAIDRNLYGHTSENEEAEELYLRALLSLVILRKFICTIQMKEKRIDENERLAFRQKYIQLIQDLMDVLDSERIELIQRDKDIEKDIQRILNSDTPDLLWSKISETYFKRYWTIEKDPDRCAEFWIRASDSGIKNAHTSAVTGYLLRKDYANATEKIVLSYKDAPYDNTPSLIDNINSIILYTGKCPHELEEIIEDLRKQGKCIESAELEKTLFDDNGHVSFKHFIGYRVK